jgi:hypothetical protein
MLTVQTHFSPDQRSNLPETRTCEGPEAAPKHTMVNQQEMNIPLDCRRNRLFTRIYGGSQASDLPSPLNLKAVQRVWVIGEGFGLKQVVEEIEDLFYFYHFPETPISLEKERERSGMQEPLETMIVENSKLDASLAERTD